MNFDDFWHDLKRLRRDRGPGAASLIAWRETPSSHQTARRLVQEYSSEDSATPRVDIVALEQSAGHGREGRSWSSPPAAGLYASVVRSLSAKELPRLPLLVPVALAEALSEATAGRCRIKWPNDLVVEGAKLGGILIDVSAQGDRRTAVISFGVNIAEDLTVFDQPQATSLGALGWSAHGDSDHRGQDRFAGGEIAALFDHLLMTLDAALDADAEVIDRYRRLSAHRDGELVRWRQGGNEVEGLFRGFDDHGRLRLEAEGEELLVAAGSLLSTSPALGDEAEDGAADDPT